jgi:hypothetical protein
MFRPWRASVLLSPARAWHVFRLYLLELLNWRHFRVLSFLVHHPFFSAMRRLAFCVVVHEMFRLYSSTELTKTGILFL